MQPRSGGKGDGFLLIGVLDLECHCDVAMVVVRPDNNAEIRPAAFTAHVNICSGQFLADFFLNILQNRLNNIAILIAAGHRDGQVFLIFAIHMDFADQLCTKDLNAGVQVLLQISIRNSCRLLSFSFTLLACVMLVNLP